MADFRKILLVYSSLFFLIFARIDAASVGLTLSGNQTLVLNQNQTIVGDINLSGHAALTIKNAVITLQHATNPREEVNLKDNAQLILENGSLVPDLLDPANLYLTAWGNSEVKIDNGTIYNVVNLVDNAKVIGHRAHVYSSTYPFYIPETGGAFGIVQLASNASANFSDSVVGSFALFFDAQDIADLSGLGPRTYQNFNLKRDARQFSPSYNIILKNTTIMPVVLHGPFERSWAIFVNPASNVTVRNSSLNKLVFQQFQNVNLSFGNLKLNTPQNFGFQKVRLINSSIANEWGFFGANSSFVFRNSTGLWLWPIGSGTWKMYDSHMIEFDPRGFTGSMVFNNSEWANAGEIYQGSNMLISGTVTITQNLSQHLVLFDSRITRIYSVQNSTQNITFSFTPDNYKGNFSKEVVIGGVSKNITFSLFSNTPLSLAPPSTTTTTHTTTQQTTTIQQTSIPQNSSGVQQQVPSGTNVVYYLVGVVVVMLAAAVYWLRIRRKIG